LSQASGVSNDGSATLRAEVGNLKVYNINFVNSYGKGSQAVAVSAQGDKTGFYGVSFKGKCSSQCVCYGQPVLTGYLN
jgi:pectinesterase